MYRDDDVPLHSIYEESCLSLPAVKVVLVYISDSLRNVFRQMRAYEVCYVLRQFTPHFDCSLIFRVLDI
jgi:hypothetical protein